MIKYELPKGYYIRQFDKRNWIVAHEVPDETNGGVREVNDGYFTTVEGAWGFSVKSLFPSLAKTKTELSKLISELEKLSSPRATLYKINEVADRVPKTPTERSTVAE